MLSREDTIERLTALQARIRAVLDHEDGDRQSGLEQTDVELSAILGDLTPAERSGIELIIDLMIPIVPFPGSLCTKCNGCNDHECRCPAALKCICN